MLIEVVAYSLHSCLVAEAAGAGRIELCGGQPEGGTTPSIGLIMNALAQVSIPIVVMIRPRGGDFCYFETELAIIQTDLEICKAIGVKEVVFGVLKPNGSLNVATMADLISIAAPMRVSCHRAIDMTDNPLEMVDALITLGCKRILTSGAKNKAIEGIETIKAMVEKAAGRIEIMAGSGVNDENAFELSETGVDALHLSGSEVVTSKMTFKNEAILMAGSAGTSEYYTSETNLEKVRAVVDLFEINKKRDSI